MSDMKNEIDALMRKKGKAVTGEIKGIRDDEEFNLPAHNLSDGTVNKILAFARVGAGGAVTESIGIRISTGSLGKDVVLPSDDANVEVFYKGSYNSLAKGTVKVSYDSIGKTFFGSLEGTVDGPDATVRELKNCIFSIK